MRTPGAGAGERNRLRPASKSRPWPLVLACYVTGGWAPGWAGLRALRDKRLDMDLLMVLTAIRVVIGQVLDGGLLIVIFATSGALEAVATQCTAESVHGLLDLAPKRATRLTTAGEESVDTATLTVGDMILVRPGERTCVDGQVLDGVGDVDQALPRAMTFMIVASPCAVVLATMPPLLPAMANAGRHGVLVRVALVGDGVNDAPALAAAHTGIAIGKPDQI